MRYITLLILSLSIVGCGAMEKSYDEANYESLSNERAYITMYSGGSAVRVFSRATIIYADSDSQTMLIRDENGKKFYLQGDLVADIE